MGRSGIVTVLAFVITSVGCDSATGPDLCEQARTIHDAGICLDFSSAGSLVALRDLLEEEAGRTLDIVQPLLDVSELRIAVVADPNRVIPEIGLGGFNPHGHEVRLYVDPSWPNLESVLRAHVMPTLAHEIHHAMRRRAVGYGSTLLQAAISEGLADHFSIEVSGSPVPPWATALSTDELDMWLPEVLAKATGPYDHDTWFFGTGPEIPRWTGYAVGFELVRLYLDRNPGTRASGLVGEPAISFVPTGT